MTPYVTRFKSTVYRILILRDACSNAVWKEKVILLPSRLFRDSALFQNLNKQIIFFCDASQKIFKFRWGVLWYVRTFVW